MNTPVLIAARNEAANIESTLRSLPSDCDPVVIPNGCTDGTEFVLYGLQQELGFAVAESDQEGKMPALQAGMRYIGRQALQGPFITLDAHNKPLFRNGWIPAMMNGRNKLSRDRPAVAVGLGLYVQGVSPAADLMHTVGQFRRQYQSRFASDKGYFPGFNMLIDVAGNETAFDDLLDLPNYWPGEDEAIKDVIVDHGGNTIKVLSPLAMTTFPARRMPGVFERLRISTQEAGAHVQTSYLNDAPPGSFQYPHWINRKPLVSADSEYHNR